MGYSCDICEKILDAKDRLLFKYSLKPESQNLLSMISDNSRKFYVCRICGLKLENTIEKTMTEKSVKT
jgi:hypothetical protein